MKSCPLFLVKNYRFQAEQKKKLSPKHINTSSWAASWSNKEWQIRGTVPFFATGPHPDHHFPRARTQIPRRGNRSHAQTPPHTHGLVTGVNSGATGSPKLKSVGKISNWLANPIVPRRKTTTSKNPGKLLARKTESKKESSQKNERKSLSLLFHIFPGRYTIFPLTDGNGRKSTEFNVCVCVHDGDGDDENDGRSIVVIVGAKSVCWADRGQTNLLQIEINLHNSGGVVVAGLSRGRVMFHRQSRVTSVLDGDANGVVPCVVEWMLMSVVLLEVDSVGWLPESAGLTIDHFGG